MREFDKDDLLFTHARVAGCAEVEQPVALFLMKEGERSCRMSRVYICAAWRSLGSGYWEVAW